MTTATAAVQNGDPKAAPPAKIEPVYTIHKAIPLITGAVAPIAKERKNVQQGYQFRGIDDVYAALNLLLAKYGVSILPEILDSKHEVCGQTKSGTNMYRHVVRVRYHLTASDGSTLPADSEGEGMDTGDKATAKAFSNSYKTMAFQIFAIPTAEKKDSEEESPEVVAPPPPQQIKVPKRAPPATSLGQQVLAMAKEYGYPTGELNKDLWAFCARTLNNKPSKDWTDNDFNTLEAALAEAVTVLKEQTPPAPFKPEADIPW